MTITIETRLGAIFQPMLLTNTSARHYGTTQDTRHGIGTAETGYVIRFKNTESAEAARNNTKLVKPRFGVVVHWNPTQEFDLEVGLSSHLSPLLESLYELITSE
ncbi:hypothetical protein N7537_011967 [Penicillium hordei]|jgi:hypothetical protein|uniref:Uncharacterized protein n=1 Tax=Penicillium hordei TaxID=40994 RepID=A0AAD6GV83_9EURO|nr:uncharacterized protein N7537_011967 [Penicillium hordei]KAJ5589289.1 hypothetical protein N7537_011967 [Penicillium hordei]